MFYPCLSPFVLAWPPPLPPIILCHFSTCTRRLLLLGPERGSGESSPAGAGPTGWRYLSVRGSICLWDFLDLDIIGLIVIFVFKERFPLKFSFEQKSLKDDQDLLEKYLQQLNKF